MIKENLENILTVVESIKKVNLQEGSNTVELVSYIDNKISWEKQEIENQLSINLPNMLVGLWNKTGGLHLFEDKKYGQSGLIIWSPRKTLEQQKQYRDYREDDFFDGDLVIGEFLGESDLVIMRCDKLSIDFGEVLIALPIDPRKDWHKVASSLSEFLEKFIENNGDKYWE